MFAQPALGHGVDLVEREARVGAAQGRAAALHGQHRRVQVALGGREARAHGEGAGHVGDVAAEFLQARDGGASAWGCGAC